MLTFIIIGAVGLCLLVGSMLLGEILEFGDSAVSGTSLGVGGVVFGALGALALINNLPTWTAYVGSTVIAVVVVVLVQSLVKRLGESEDGIPQSVVGVEGTVTSDITSGKGEVSLDTELERRLAWSDQTIPEGTRVVVLEQSGGRVRVSPHWPAQSQTPSGRPPRPTPFS